MREKGGDGEKRKEEIRKMQIKRKEREGEREKDERRKIPNMMN